MPDSSVGFTGGSAGRAVAGRHDACTLEHEDHGPLRRPVRCTTPLGMANP
jgi:hypothetical protein